MSTRSESSSQVKVQHQHPIKPESRSAPYGKKTSKRGTDYLSGVINGVRIVVFPVTDKRGPQSPDYWIFRSEAPPAVGEDSF